ncbi:hypothetical protein FACS189490_13650 [Clostridia bacterium]|nr:hypothetical protein FACS189490_13650 [Clostridia bacterium]
MFKKLVAGIVSLTLSLSAVGTVFAAPTEATVILDTMDFSIKSELFVTDRVNFRKGISTDTEVIEVISRGESVGFIGIAVNVNGEEWALVRYGEKQGYIKAEFLSDKEPALSNVELLNWSDAKRIFTIGVAAEVYDVRSGITYYVKSFSNGSHADVEPITKEDTALMKRTYGGVWQWDPRPVIVTINGHSMAAAINGMPHGGGVNGANGMDGQVCIHFKGSTVHNGNLSYAREFQAAVMEAWYAVQ